MPHKGPLVGRARELGELDQLVREACAGGGSLVLVAGEAGVGKTRLAEEVLAAGDALALVAEASPERGVPYGPILRALRASLRVEPGGLDDCGPLSRYLRVLLPELGPAPDDAAPPTLFEALRCAFVAIAKRRPAVVFLDDIHWADEATLELLTVLAAPLEEEPIALLATYRSDEIPRDHPVRRLRLELRRANRLKEIALEPLTTSGTGELLADVLGRRPSGTLVAAIHDRTQGFPFFIEELGTALRVSGRLHDRPAGVELDAGSKVPIPETVRDAIRVRVQGLSERAVAALEAAAVIGVRFELALVEDLAGAEALWEGLERGLVVEREFGVAAFRHALTREAFYADTSWPRRSALHRQVAAILAARGDPPAVVAEHWLGAREFGRARRALVAAADSFAAVHAHRDATRVARQALELWPDGEDEPGRLATLDRLAKSAALSGDAAEARAAWRQAAECWAREGDSARLAHVRRQLAALHELQCEWPEAFAARDAAAEGFAAAGLAGDAAAERLAAAANLQSAGNLSAAMARTEKALLEAETARRRDLQARALGLRGLILARLGDVEAGLRAAQEGLSLALGDGLTTPAAEVYERLGMILENASDYRAAVETWAAALDFCQAHGVHQKAQLCLGCLAYVMRKTGEWNRAVEVCHEVMAAADAPRSATCAAIGELGVIEVLRGQVASGRRRLEEALALAERTGFMFMRIDCAWGLARADMTEGRMEAATSRCRDVVEIARAGEDSHYPVAALRTAVSVFALSGAAADAGAGAQILADIASATGNTEALAALAHALGEIGLLDGDADQAASHFLQALDLLREVDLPLERAETAVRAGAALAAAGEREAAMERLTDAYRVARRLGARPFTREIAAQLAVLGEKVDRRLGPRAAFALEHGGLTRRELEVVRLVAVGRTNREIARELFLSPRTVDMHVRHILAKLGCRSRTEATTRAGELGLLGTTATTQA